MHLNTMDKKLEWFDKWIDNIEKMEMFALSSGFVKSYSTLGGFIIVFHSICSQKGLVELKAGHCRPVLFSVQSDTIGTKINKIKVY